MFGRDEGLFFRPFAVFFEKFLNSFFQNVIHRMDFGGKYYQEMFHGLEIVLHEVIEALRVIPEKRTPDLVAA